MHPISERAMCLAIAAGIFAIACSDTVGGMCFRAAFLVPAAWLGVVDFETAAHWAAW